MWPPETRRLTGFHLLSVTPEEGEGHWVDSGGHLLVVSGQLWLVWGRQRRKGDRGSQSQSFQQLLLWEEFGRLAGEYGTSPHIKQVALLQKISWVLALKTFFWGI